MQILELVFNCLKKKIFFKFFLSLLNGVWSMVHMDVVFLTDLILSLKVK